MPGWAWAIVGVMIALALIGIAAAPLRRRRSARLREGFGQEYRRAVAERGDRRDAEWELLAREERRDSFDIRPLSPPERERYAEAWRAVQAEFVDRPHGVPGRGGPPHPARDGRPRVPRRGVRAAVRRPLRGPPRGGRALPGRARDLRRHGRGGVVHRGPAEGDGHYRAMFVDLLDEPDPTPVEGGRR